MKQHITSLVVGILSGVVTLWITPFTRLPNGQEPGLVSVLLAPVPAVAFFFVVAFAFVVAWAVTARTVNRSESDTANHDAALEQEREKVRALIRQLEKQKQEAKDQRAARFVLARLVMSEILSSEPGARPTSGQVAESLVKQQGNTHTVREIAEVIAWMIAENVVTASQGKLQEGVGWEQRLAYLANYAG